MQLLLLQFRDLSIVDYLWWINLDNLFDNTEAISIFCQLNKLIEDLFKNELSSRLIECVHDFLDNMSSLLIFG